MTFTEVNWLNTNSMFASCLDRISVWSGRQTIR